MGKPINRIAFLWHLYDIAMEKNNFRGAERVLKTLKAEVEKYRNEQQVEQLNH